MRYSYLVVESTSLEKLTETVNIHMMNGWEPSGSMSTYPDHDYGTGIKVNLTVYLQAMTTDLEFAEPETL